MKPGKGCVVASVSCSSSSGPSWGHGYKTFFLLLWRWDKINWSVCPAKTSMKSLPGTNTTAYLVPSSVTKTKGFVRLKPEPNIIKLFYGRNLQMFVISKSICPWQVFLALSIVSVGSYPSEATFFQVLISRVGSWPYPQTLCKAGEACQGQTLKLKG